MLTMGKMKIRTGMFQADLYFFWRQVRLFLEKQSDSAADHGSGHGCATSLCVICAVVPKVQGLATDNLRAGGDHVRFANTVGCWPLSRLCLSVVTVIKNFVRTHGDDFAGVAGSRHRVEARAIVAGSSHDYKPQIPQFIHFLDENR